MPIEMKYVDDAIGVLYIAKGTLTGEDIIKADKKQLSNIDSLKKKKYFLGDFSGADAVEISTEELEQIAELGKEMKSIAGNNVIAMVADPDLMSGLNKMWKVIVDIEGYEWHTNIFRKRDAAEIWLKSIAKNLFAIDLTIQNSN